MIRFQEKSEEDLKQMQQAMKENPLIQEILKELKEKDEQIQQLQDQLNH